MHFFETEIDRDDSHGERAMLRFEVADVRPTTKIAHRSIRGIIDRLKKKVLNYPMKGYDLPARRIVNQR